MSTMTTTTKHTPGPWKYSERTQTIRSTKENYWIATMDSFEGSVSNQANARLIAAAPELLEACREALNVIFPTEQDTISDRAIKKIVQAIIKAEGATV